MDTQTELERLREENDRLRSALAERQQLPAPKLPSPQSLINDQGFLEDLARFTDGILTEKQVRQKYHLFNEATWEQLAKDEALIEAIELERTRRVRSGATKRELAQNHIVSAPKILNDILTDPKANAKHRIDSAKALDALANPGSQAADTGDRVIVTITLSADEKLTFNKPIRPTPNDDKIVDVTPAPVPGFDP
jgi:hypothetical protein